MSGREVREYTNLSDPKDKKFGKGKDRIDDEDITFQRMVAKMQEVAGERGGYLHGRGGIVPYFLSIVNTDIFPTDEFLDFAKCKNAALDSDDLLYLKEQMEAEEDAERLLRRTEKRAFAAFKKAATLADSSQALVPLPLRVEPKPKSGIRQQDLLKKVLEVKPKRQKVSSPRDGNESTDRSSEGDLRNHNSDATSRKEEKCSPTVQVKADKNDIKTENPIKSLVAAYESSGDEDE